MFFFVWQRHWWELRGEDALVPAEESFRAAEQKAFEQSGFHSYEECAAWNAEQSARRGRINHTPRGYFGPKKVAGSGCDGPVASNYRSSCPHYKGYYLGGEYPGSWTECALGGIMTGAAWYEYCRKCPENCPLRQKEKTLPKAE